MISDLTPAVARAQLCAELVKARTNRGMTQNETAAALEWSWSKVIRIEAGVVGISATDLRALLNLYGGYDEQRIEHLLSLARTARLAPWWNAYKDLVSPAAGRVLDYERQAVLIRAFHPVIVPGLLQTEDYAAATFTGLGTDEQTVRRVELRMRRQEILRGDEPARATILIAEAALYNRMESRATMAAQLRALLEHLADGPVELGVIPFGRSVYPEMLTPFTLLELPEGESLFFSESPHDSRAAKNDAELELHYAAYFRRLQDEHACFGPDAAALIGRALERLDADADEQHT